MERLEIAAIHASAHYRRRIAALVKAERECRDSGRVARALQCHEYIRLLRRARLAEEEQPQ